VRISELSRASDVPIATIKFYVREGLLPPGELSHPNQASYSGEHVRRLRLIRALTEVGGLSVSSAREVIAAIDSDLPVANVFEIAQHTVSSILEKRATDPDELGRIDRLLSGWNYSPDNPGRLAAARVISTFEAAGQSDDRGWYVRYAAAALLAAEADIDELQTRPDRLAQAETVVVGTVLGDALFAAFRRLAQEHITSLRFGGGPTTPEIEKDKP
jgi:DNA-binding transcriptional MerR regulator